MIGWEFKSDIEGEFFEVLQFKCHFRVWMAYKILVDRLESLMIVFNDGLELLDQG
jgi:hypothetical protein